MKTACLIFALLSFGVITHVQAAEDMDKALSELASRLAKSTQEAGKQKITVADFSDLQGSANELGRFVAEELTVNLVMVKSNFSVLDRANLKKILAEHKLTATGLIDPENAKKLGQFAGVDALVLGTVVARGQKVSVTAKIIATDTAEIVGAGKTEFATDESTQKLLSTATKTEGGDDAASSETKAAPKGPKLFGDLQAKIESVKLLAGDQVYGFARLSFIITNTSATTTYGVALHEGIYDNLNLTNERGDDFKATEMSGIQKAFESGNGFAGDLTDLPPRSAITITSKSQVRWTTRPGDYRPYRLQTIVIFGEEVNGRHPNLRKYNLILDYK